MEIGEGETLFTVSVQGHFFFNVLPFEFCYEELQRFDEDLLQV